MGELHIHPDKLIYIRLGLYDIHYVDTYANFILDCPEVRLTPLQEGVEELIYTQGKRHALMTNGDIVDGGPMPWNTGDWVIDRLADILLAQKNRQEAEIKRLKEIEENKPKTPEQIEGMIADRIFKEIHPVQQLRMITKAINLLIKSSKLKELTPDEATELSNIETKFKWIENQWQNIPG